MAYMQSDGDSIAVCHWGLQVDSADHTDPAGRGDLPDHRTPPSHNHGCRYGEFVLNVLLLPLSFALLRRSSVIRFARIVFVYKHDIKSIIPLAACLGRLLWQKMDASLPPYQFNGFCRAKWQVLVMDSGRVAEYAPPRELCDRQGGILSSLIDETGPSSSERLRRLV
jgi:hypothetical protein